MKSLTSQEAHTVTVREALERLVEAVEYAATMPTGADRAQRYWYSPQWALDDAREALALDPNSGGAYRAYLVQLQIATLAYVFADFLHLRLRGTPRHTDTHEVTPDDVLEALDELQRLTQQSFNTGAQP